MNIVGFSRGVAAIALGLCLCSCGSSERIEFDPLSDASADWQPVAEALLASETCLPVVSLAAQLEIGHDVEGATWLRDQLSIEGVCGVGGEDWRQMAFELAIALSESGIDEQSKQQRLRDRRDGIPAARSPAAHEFGRLGITISDELSELEHDWIVRCEGPMDLGTGYQYGMRQLLASVTDDASWLLPVWEARIEECRPKGMHLVERYQSMAASAVDPERHEAFEQVALSMERVLREFEPGKPTPY